MSMSFVVDDGWVYDHNTRGMEHEIYGNIVYIGPSNPALMSGPIVIFVDMGGSRHGPFRGYSRAQWYAWLTEGGFVPFPEMGEEDRIAARLAGKRWLMTKPPRGQAHCDYCAGPVGDEWIYRPKAPFGARVECPRCFMIERIKGKVAYEYSQKIKGKLEHVYNPERVT